MITVDIKTLLGRLNPFCTRALEGAAGLCVSRTHYEVTVEHMLAKILEEPQSDVSLILKNLDVDPGRVRKVLDQTIEEFRTGNASKPVFSPLLLEWIQDAWLTASVDLEETRIRSGALLLAFLARPIQLGSGRYVELLKAIGREGLLAQFGNVVKGSIEVLSAEDKRQFKESAAPAGDGTALSRFCTDFTAKAAAGEIDPVFGRDREIHQMVDILARRRKNNPIVVGEPGVGKTAVVEGLALRVVEGDVPDLLKGVTILGLDMGLLQAGAGVKGEFENRLKSVINEIKSSPKPIVLFIDEAHTLIGAGGSAGGSDAANLLKPALARGELRTVAATTWSEYKKYFEKDAALARRFQLVKLDEPSKEMAVLILRGLKDKYEDAHKVVIRDDAIVSAAELSSRYISGRQLPDKAVDLLDTAAARVKVVLSAKPDVIEDKERGIQALERERKALDRDRTHGFAVDEERVASIEANIARLGEEVAALTERWKKEQAAAQALVAARRELFELRSGGGPPEKQAEAKEIVDRMGKELAEIQGDAPLIRIEVDPDIVAKVVSDWTGIPLGKVLRDEAGGIMNLEANLKTRIKGQDEAIGVLAEAVRASKTGLTDPRQPMGVFLFVGPSGVGKTELGLTVADLLFGGERFMVTINMSEFQEKHTVSRLIGSPPGYVGYGEGGVLTEAVRQRPYSVVLLDEVEKADLEVMNLFYQVFDKGSLSDGEGRDIDFKNTILFLTSNLATDVITQMCADGQRPSVEVLTAAIRPILSGHFKPALLARMTIVPFYILDAKYIREIVELKLRKLGARLAESNKMKMTFAPEVAEAITARCTEVETGARNIDHILRGTVLPMLSREILVRMGEAGMPSGAHLGVAEDGSFKVDFTA
ncbi:MAG TPA: type VI secretion system ATPase TssH [Candidatus Deferrimicrobiaceae bacterium]